MGRTSTISTILLSITLLLSILAPASAPATAAMVTPPTAPSSQAAPAAQVPQVSGSYVQVAAGDYHTCALTEIGTVYCWGWNEYGQLGDGTITTRLMPIAVSGLSAVKAVAAGGGHSCALLKDGTVRCWGGNSAGQLGDNSTIDHLTPVTVYGLSSVIAISAGGGHSCALLTDATVHCWGANYNGQLGDDTTANRLIPVPVSGLNKVSAISAGPSSTCALGEGGKVYCWGDNYYGQLGDDTKLDRTTPVVVNGVSNATAITTGMYQSCAILADAQVYCWGVVGNTYPTRMVIPGLTRITAIATRWFHTCALGTGGKAYCWGGHGLGELGDGTRVSSPIPVPVSGLLGAVGISVGWNHSCAVLLDRSIRCWGSNRYGQLGIGIESYSLAPLEIQGLKNVVSIGAGYDYTCALLGDGTVQCWGSNDQGQLGDSTTTDRLTPVAVTGLHNVTAIEVGNSHACALLADSTIRCWGSNDSGKVGDGTKTNHLFPVAVNGLSGVVAITAGSNHTCALLKDRQVYCWGRNDQGQLGDGTTTNQLSPVAVIGLGEVTSISAGRDHTCAIVLSEQGYCWGNNDFGQLGDGTITDRPTPVLVNGLNGARVIAAGLWSTCALLAGGTVNCWGHNFYGQLGNGQTSNSKSPVAVQSLKNVTALAAQDNHFCALLTDQHIYCWGQNEYGELGNGQASYRQTTPVLVRDIYGATALTTGYSHSCAVIAEGKVRCWGDNLYGQLGNGLAGYSAVPVLVVGSGSDSNPGRPLIFVPGIMGSYLDLGPCNIWPGVPRPDCPTLPSKYLLSLPSTVVVATDAIRELAGGTLVAQPFYQPLLSRLTTARKDGGAGYREYRELGSETLSPLARCERTEQEHRNDVTLFVFAYDWRLSNAANGEKLAKLVDCVQRIHPSSQVDLLTHSMGGLIARNYIVHQNGRRQINKLITIAAPWLGAPKTLVVMETGWYDPGINALFELDAINNEIYIPGIVALKLLTERFPSAYQLLPSQAYMDIFGQTPLVEQGRNIRGLWPISGRQVFDYPTYAAWLDQHYILGEPGTANRAFHQGAQDDWRNDADWHTDLTGIQYAHYHGVGDSEDTVRSFQAIWGIGCIQNITESVCIPFPGWNVDWTLGDGTVPVLSARRCAGYDDSQKQCLPDSTNLNAPGALVQSFTRNDTSESREHTAMARNSTVIQRVINNLNSPYIQTAQESTSSTLQDTMLAEAPLSAYYLDILGTGRVTIADAMGNTTDTMSGTLSTPVPDIMYMPLTDQQHVAVLQASQSYIVSFRSNTAPMLITISRGTNNTTEQATRFLDVSVPANSLLQLRITPQGVEPLQADTDNDGSFETTIQAIVNLSGATANDQTAPVIQMSHQGDLNQVTVTLNVTDDLSGVKQVLYSLDGTHFQPYTAPFTVDATKTPLIYTFADDNAANRAPLYIEQLSHQVFLPLGSR